MTRLRRPRTALVLTAAIAAFAASACFGPPPPPPPPAACQGAEPAATEGPKTEPPRQHSGAPIPPGPAGEEARQDVAESEQRTADGRVPLVTVEKPAGGRPEITTTPVANADEAAAVADQRAADGDLVVVEVDAPVEATTHNDPRPQYSLDALHINAEGAWTQFVPPFTAAGSQVIAVVDTGVQAAHEDLGDTKVREGASFLHSDDGATPFTDGNEKVDPNGHGTHVAGIAAASTNNGVGIAGVAPGAQILPVQVLCDDGRGWNSDVAEGIAWAAGNGATVINLSLGSSGASGAIQQAIQDAVNQGVTVVAAAGNTDTCPSTCYPGAFPEVLAVAATDRQNQRANFSTQGSYVDIAAPGVAIDSTWNDGGYHTLNGTSMASPHVAGSAALVRAKGCTRAQTDARLRTTAQDVGPLGVDNGTGSGLVRPDLAVMSCT